MPANPISAGLTGRCPRCGKAPLFQGLLTLRKSCKACGLSYDFADPADGPAVFAIFILGFAVVGAVLAVEFTFAPPLWLHVVIWTPVTSALSLGLLRVLKGLLIALQYSNSAEEGKLDE